MNWQHFQTYNEAPTRAFEIMCNQLFELWINRQYIEIKQSFIVVNGAGGDGGVESYVTLSTGKKICVQAKWFPGGITTSQFNQIKTSILTALEVHSDLIKYIICIPRDLSNLKKGRDGRIVKETEYSKWEKIIASIKNKHPDIEIILWCEHDLEIQLQYADAAGIMRYWFEKGEISKEIIKYSFDKQIHGWMKQRYIPVLHNQGTINESMNAFLGDFNVCSLLLEKLENIVEIHVRLLYEINVLCNFLSEKKLYKERISELQDVSRRINLQCTNLEKLKVAFQYEEKLDQWNEQILNYEKFEKLEIWLNECCYSDWFHHFWDVKVLIEKLRKNNMTLLFENMKQRCNFEKIVVIGGQGTGKTHGIANVTEMHLEKGYHIPILIQAKSISPQDEWKDIMIRILGLSQNWSEEELWSALEAMSYRNEINNAIPNVKGNKIRIIPKIIICIDGIDEIRPYERWNERINQVNAVTSRHHRIRFCFTGRSYAFEENIIQQTQNVKKVCLADDGDVPVRRIYNQYIEHYNVNDDDAKWLRYSISTPYTLKLLCELYKNKHVGQIEKSDITISNLLQEKFERLDYEFKKMVGIDDNVKDQIVKTVLLEINEMFELHNEVEWTQMKVNLRQLDIYHLLKDPGLNSIVDFLEKHSFLQSYKRYPIDFFDKNETIYLLGTQPIYDYLKALRLFDKNEYSDELILDDSVLGNTNAMKIYSIMVMNRFEKTLWKNKSCQEYYHEEDLFKIVAFSLVNVNVGTSLCYAEWLRKSMLKNACALSLIVNHVILPLARCEKHPLGSLLLDQCLSEFNKPAYRDMIWSIPTCLNGNDKNVWIRYDEIDYSNESYELEKDDLFDGMPLVWAWGLSSVNNKQRTTIRQEITKWGIARPEEFYKLFEHFIDVNDIQLLVDIFAIAMSISNVCRKNKIFLKMISKLVYNNVFQYKKIKNINNAAIRYYSRAIMECAYSEKLITCKQIEKCRPPYRTNSALLSFASEATKGTRMRGYKTINYDLARYVLCDPLDRKFFNNANHQCAVDKLIEEYADSFGLPDLTSEKWILGIAFGFLKQAGWNDNLFYGKPNGGKHEEDIGLDIAIGRRYRSASHGSMSSIMTITEKYVWCAKMELLGYLADRLPYCGYESVNCYVQDYGQLDDYVNPYQELCEANLEKINKDVNWLMPEELASSIEGCEYNEEGIQKWLLDSPVPDFEKWIHAQHDLISLYGFHHISNEIQGISTMMWLSSGLVKKGSITSLVKALKNKEFAREVINVSDVYGYPATDCYVSPLEVCWFNWKEEYASSLKYGNNMLGKNVARCICKIQGKEEIEYMMPSKMLREMMAIISGDGYHYYDSEGVEIASFRNAGEYYCDSQQILLVDVDVFNAKAEEHGLQPVWFIRVLKEMSSKARERLNYVTDKDDTYLVWKSSNQWRIRKIEY